MFENIKTYWNEHDMDRFVPWKRRVCEHCGYPLSEKQIIGFTASGKTKPIYCCNICYELKERNMYGNG